MLTFKVILAFCVEQIVLWKTFDKIGLLTALFLTNKLSAVFFINNVDVDLYSSASHSVLEK